MSFMPTASSTFASFAFQSTCALAATVCPATASVRATIRAINAIMDATVRVSCQDQRLDHGSFMPSSPGLRADPLVVRTPTDSRVLVCTAIDSTQRRYQDGIHLK